MDRRGLPVSAFCIPIPTMSEYGTLIFVRGPCIYEVSVKKRTTPLRRQTLSIHPVGRREHIPEHNISPFTRGLLVRRFPTPMGASMAIVWTQLSKPKRLLQKENIGSDENHFPSSSGKTMVPHHLDHADMTQTQSSNQNTHTTKPFVKSNATNYTFHDQKPHVIRA